MFKEGKDVLSALQGFVPGLGPSVNLLERFAALEQQLELPLQGVLDNLRPFCGLGRFMALPSYQSTESWLSPGLLRNHILNEVRRLTQEVTEMQNNARLLALQKFNSLLWRRVWEDLYLLCAGKPNKPLQVDVPPVPPIDPALLQYFQNHLHFAVLYLPGEHMPYDSKTWFPEPVRVETIGYDFLENHDEHPYLSGRKAILPAGISEGWYAVEIVPPGHFGHAGTNGYDPLAEAMGFKSRHTSWLDLVNVRMRDVASFLGVPRESILIPSAEEIVLFDELFGECQHIPGHRQLCMPHSTSCIYLADDHHPEICRNLAVTATEDGDSEQHIPGVVMGGNGGRTVSEKNPREFRLLHADLSQSGYWGFRLMFRLSDYVGLKFSRPLRRKEN